MRSISILSLLLLSACVTATQGFYYMGGRRADATQDLLAQLGQDKMICNGKAADSMMKVERPRLTQAQLAQFVFEGCMAERGWQIRPK